MGALHLVKISGISGSVVNGTRFVGSSHWKIPRKSGKSKKVGPFPRLEFPNGMSCSIYLSRSLYQFQVHRRAPRRTGVYDQMEQRFTNRKFHFCSHRNFRVFLLNGKRPMFSVPWFDYNLKDCVLSAMYREFGFRNTGSFCLWEPGIREIWVVESWILGFGFQNTAHGIQNPTDDVIRSPESKFPDKKSGIQYLESGIQVL